MLQGSTAHVKDFFLYLFVIIALIVVGVFLLSRDSKDTSMNPKSPQDSNSTNTKNYSSAPSLTIDTKKKYTAKVKTSKGLFEIELFANETPQAVNNFVFLAKDGFYNKTVFHRVIKGFMIQGGDPNGNGGGGPGYTFADEKVTRDYTRGIVAMANRGPNTNGSQFFIMHADYSLPKQYVIFGKVTSGMETVDAIATAPIVESQSGEASQPKEPASIESINIVQQ